MAYRRSTRLEYDPLADEGFVVHDEVEEEQWCRSGGSARSILPFLTVSTTTEDDSSTATAIMPTRWDGHPPATTMRDPPLPTPLGPPNPTPSPSPPATPGRRDDSYDNDNRIVASTTATGTTAATTCYVLDISPRDGGTTPCERHLRNAERVVQTGIIYAMFPGGLNHARRIHCALDAWIDRHSRLVDVVTPHHVQTILTNNNNSNDETTLPGGLWQWTGRSFVPAPHRVALKRLTGRLRDAKRRPRRGRNKPQRPVAAAGATTPHYYHEAARTAVPIPQSFRIVVRPAAAAGGTTRRKSTRATAAAAARAANAVVVRPSTPPPLPLAIPPVRLLPNVQPLGEIPGLDLHHNNNDTKNSNIKDKHPRLNDDNDGSDDTKSAVSTITAISWIGGIGKSEATPRGSETSLPRTPPPRRRRHPKQPPPRPPPRRRAPPTTSRNSDMNLVMIDYHDPAAVLRQAEVNCLRVTCQHWRERVRYLELQQRQESSSLLLSGTGSSLLTATDEERFRHALWRLQHPYLQYTTNRASFCPSSSSMYLHVGAAASMASTSIGRVDEQEEESLHYLGNNDGEEDGAPLLYQDYFYKARPTPRMYPEETTHHPQRHSTCTSVEDVLLSCAESGILEPSQDEMDHFIARDAY